MPDLRHAWRSLTGNPGFAIAAILTIALGVGVNTGIFSVLNAVAFRDLPAPEPAELVSINQTVAGAIPARRALSVDAMRTLRYE